MKHFNNISLRKNEYKKISLNKYADNLKRSKILCSLDSRDSTIKKNFHIFDVIRNIAGVL